MPNIDNELNSDERSLGRTLVDVLVPGSLIIPAIKDYKDYYFSSDDYKSSILQTAMAFKVFFTGVLEFARLTAYYGAYKLIENII